MKSKYVLYSLAVAGVIVAVFAYCERNGRISGKVQSHITMDDQRRLAYVAKAIRDCAGLDAMTFSNVVLNASEANSNIVNIIKTYYSEYEDLNVKGNRMCDSKGNAITYKVQYIKETNGLKEYSIFVWSGAETFAGQSKSAGMKFGPIKCTVN